MTRRKKAERGAPKHRASARRGRASAGAAALRFARLETIRDVAKVLAHESRNLLGALATSAQVLGKNPHLAADDRELLDILQSGARRLNEIVSEFSAFAQPSPARFEKVALGDLIEEALMWLQRDERCSSSIRVRRRFDGPIGDVPADRDKLGQLLRHLLLNAVQAMDDRGELEIETRRAGREIAIFIRDSGCGIPPEVLPRIFDPLYTTKSRGVGLGLALARRFAEEHGGRILVETEPGRGTSVAVFLPVKRPRGAA